jgi:hypothetical protein
MTRCCDCQHTSDGSSTGALKCYITGQPIGRDGSCDYFESKEESTKGVMIDGL